MKPYLEDKEAVLAEAGSSMEGLSEEEAAARLARDGHNKLKEGEKESLLRKFLGELKDPMTIVLIIAAVVSAITALYAGESLTDTIIILAVVVINACLGVYQESKAEAAIEALQQAAAATAKVIRGGHQKTIHADEVVRGDLLILEAGDAVPADARIVECASMKTQEAALTGESTDVEKQSETLAAAENGEVSLGDRKNMVYMGSIVTYGRGHAVVTGTGMDTEMGAIADALTNAKDEETPPADQAEGAVPETVRHDPGDLRLCLHCEPGAKWRKSRPGHLHDRSFPGRGGHSGRPERSGNSAAFHRCDQDEQEPCHYPETDGCGDPGLHPDYLLR